MSSGHINAPCGCGSTGYEGGCDCGCCAGTEPVTPRAIANRPGLDALAYRIGTQSEFLETMKARLSSADYPALAGLTTREADDPAIAILDAWAVVADVLTFYQERIANEGYLRTATERRSVLELARLVGYVPRPGVSASVHLAFTLEEKPRPILPAGSPAAPVSASQEQPEIVIPAGARAQSVPGPGETQQAFETSDDLIARAGWNQLQVRQTRPQQPAFFLRNDWGKAATVPLYLKGISTNLKPNDPLLIGAGAGTPFLFRIRKAETDPVRDRTRVDVEPWLPSEKASALASTPPARTTTSLTGVLDALGKPPSTPPRGGPDRQATALLAPGSDLAAKLLTVARPELRDTLYKAWANIPLVPPPGLKVCALRARASVFGHNAPLELVRRAQDGVITGTQEWELRPAGTVSPATDVVFLDNAYPQLAPGGWVVLERPDSNLGGSPLVLAQALEVKEVSRAAYGLAGKSTRIHLSLPWLRFDEPEPPDTFAVVRGTAVYAQCEELALAEAPIAEPVCGGTIELAALYDGLQPGRWLIVSGERTDIGDADPAVAAPVPGVPAAELVLLAGVSQDVRREEQAAVHGNETTKTLEPVPGESTHSTLTLAAPLAYCYKRDTLTIYGNVAHATHGESRFEVLGSGNGAKALQSFALKQTPLTYVSAPTTSGVASTLQVRVNDLLWHEAESLAGLGPADRKYTLRTDDGGQTTVVFGNGERGARLPTGSENVRAAYRSGIGRVGNVEAGQISQLASRPLGVKDVINPLPATGGGDRESRDQARRNVPLALLALDRLISVQDYEDFTRTFAGVGKASAVRLSDGRTQLVHVTLAGEDDIPIAPDSDLLANLETALRRFGDPRQPLRLELRRRTFLVLQVNVKLFPDYLWEAVEPKIRAALLDAFGFARRDLGQDALLSEVYATIQRVRGVDLADVDLFARKDPDDLNAPLDTGRDSSQPSDLPAPRLRARLARVDGQGTIQPAEILYLTPEVADTLILKERKS